MDQARLTLGDLLGMRLEQHADTVAQLCGAALKELTIEAELRKIAEGWRSQRFTLHRYTRADERGWLLKGEHRLMLTSCILWDNIAICKQDICPSIAACVATTGCCGAGSVCDMSLAPQALTRSPLCSRTWGSTCSPC
jgi:hypothetical protein